MTCTQRNSLVFMTSTFILFLQVQIYPAALNSFHQEYHQQNPNDYHQHYHRHPHHHQHHHRHHHRHDHHNISNQSNHTVDQYNHLRHSSYRHHHIPVRNREQVQQHHLHNFQHKITSTINSTPTYSWRSADKIQHPLPSSPPFYSHERYNTTRHKIHYWKNSSSSTLGSNNDDRNRNDGGVDYNGGRFFFISDNNHQNITLKSHQHSSNNNNSNNNHHRRKTFNRNTLQPYNDNDSSTPTLIEDSYLTQSSKSKGRSDNVNRYGILDSKSITQQTTKSKSKSKKVWQSSKKSNSWYLLRPHSRNNNENGLDNSESEDYYDDDQDDEFIDAEDNDENDDDNHDDDDDDDVIKNDRLIESNQFKLSNTEQKFTPITTMSTPKTIQKLHSDLSYDYLYDEPTNGSGTITDEKSGSLTEEKWRNYGTAEAVEKSRRRHLSEAQIIAAHITRINLEAMCKYPRPKIIQINEASKRYVPHCTVLHRCGDDTGCCHSETQTCVAKKTVTVDLHFYAIPLKTKDPIVEILSFVNHTECHCVDRYPIRSGSTTFSPSSDNNRNSKNLNYGNNNNNNNSDQKNHKNSTTCNCIRHFDIFEEDFDDDSDYQQQQSDTSSSLSSITKAQSSICRCDCTSDNLTCQRLKRGQEGIPVDDRRCISEGRCVPPTCEYGLYIRSSGRCPRVMVKRTTYGTT